LILADALDRDALRAAVRGERVDAVVHALTALRKPPLRHRDMAQTDLLRERGTTNLLIAARDMGARRFVAESMTLGYGYGDWGERIITEDRLFAPPGRSPALERHLAGFRSIEGQVFTASRAGWIDGISVRYGAIYGPRAGTEEMVRILERRFFPLPDGGRAVTSWVHVEDAAAATVAAIEHGSPGEAYNVVDDAPVSLRAFVDLLADTAEVPRAGSMPGWVLRLVFPYAAAVFTTTLRASNLKARRELGWTPMFPTYREGLSETVELQRAA
jgi:nucleoside-diphosphate-sugar epimerase